MTKVTTKPHEAYLLADQNPSSAFDAPAPQPPERKVTWVVHADDPKEKSNTILYSITLDITLDDQLILYPDRLENDPEHALTLSQGGSGETTYVSYSYNKNNSKIKIIPKNLTMRNWDWEKNDENISIVTNDSNNYSLAFYPQGLQDTVDAPITRGGYNRLNTSGCQACSDSVPTGDWMTTERAAADVRARAAQIPLNDDLVTDLNQDGLMDLVQCRKSSGYYNSPDYDILDAWNAVFGGNWHDLYSTQFFITGKRE
jgi:hypothetical protein